jgi:hypothetical protein
MYPKSVLRPVWLVQRESLYKKFFKNIAKMYVHLKRVSTVKEFYLLN